MSPFISYAADLTNHPDCPDLMNLFGFVWLEGVLKAELDYLRNQPEWNDLSKWPAGRLFGPLGEYRWRSAPGGKLHAVILLDEGEPPPEFQAGRLEIEPDRNSEDHDDSYSPLILWGEWIDPDREKKDLRPELKSNPDGGPLFYAQEIPRILEYPFTPEEARKGRRTNGPGATPRLIARRYRHAPKNSEDYQGEFIRCVGFCMLLDPTAERTRP
jgi:hypothetical protein